MRYWTRRCPALTGVLLVESGARTLTDGALDRLRAALGEDTRFDLLTCHAGAPTSLAPGARIWRTQEYRDRPSRARLLGEVRASGATVLAIVCSGDPSMARWKWWLAWRLPMKVLVVNENADCFWLDTGNVGNARRLLAARIGVSERFSARAAAQAAVLPLVVAYLLAYAALVHGRRALRLVFAARV